MRLNAAIDGAGTMWWSGRLQHGPAQEAPLDDETSHSYVRGMRPLFHPANDDITLEGVLHALADRVRLRIFADLVDAEIPLGCTPYLRIGDRNLSKSTISHHFRVLRESGLIRSERRGPGLVSVARWADLQERFGSLIDALLQAYRAEAYERPGGSPAMMGSGATAPAKGAAQSAF